MKETAFAKANRVLRVAAPALVISTLVGAGIAGAQGFGQNAPGRFEPGFIQNAPGPIESGVNRPGFTPNRPGFVEPGFNRPGNFGQSGGVGTGSNLAGSRVVNATVDEILDRPRAYVGQLVLVTGEIGDRIGRRGFTLEDGDLAFDDDVLVLGANRIGAVRGFDRAFAAGDLQARVAGVVRMFNRRDVEREFGLTLEQGLFSEFEGQPVIIAAAVDIGNGFVQLTPDIMSAGAGVNRGTGVPDTTGPRSVNPGINQSGNNRLGQNQSGFDQRGFAPNRPGVLEPDRNRGGAAGGAMERGFEREFEREGFGLEREGAFGREFEREGFGREREGGFGGQFAPERERGFEREFERGF